MRESHPTDWHGWQTALVLVGLAALGKQCSCRATVWMSLMPGLGGASIWCSTERHSDRWTPGIRFLTNSMTERRGVSRTGHRGARYHRPSFGEKGQIVRDEYTVPIAPSTPPGDIPLLVGMYSLDTGERLPVCDPDGAPIGDTIPLAVVTVR